MTSRDERVEAFLQDALSLQDERLAQVREGVRIYIARYEKDFPDLDIRALCRKRVREEMDRCKGTSAEGLVSRSVAGPNGSAQLYRR